MITIKNLIFDIECYPNFFVLSTKDIDSGERHRYHLGEDLIRDILFNTQINLIGWNNHSYDNLLLNYITQETIPKMSGWGAQIHTQVTEQSLYELSNRIINSSNDDEYLKQLRFADRLYQSQDIKALLDPLPGLKKIEMRIGFKNVQDLPLPPGTELTDQQQEIVTEYCDNDIDATHEVYEKYAKQHIELRTYLARRFSLPAEKLISMSEPRTAEYILSSESTRHSHQKPWEIKRRLEVIDTLSPPMVSVASCIPEWIEFRTSELKQLIQNFTKLKLPLKSSGHPDAGGLKQTLTLGNKTYQLGAGGLHSIDTPGNWTTSDAYTLVEADATSYYPSILLRDELYPRGYDDYWTYAYQRIYDERMQAKDDPTKSIESYALKIILNATFGKFGSHFSSFYDPSLLIRVTLTGQLGLLMLIEACTEQGIEVLSANTDGIMVKLKKDQLNAWNDVCQWWQDHTKFTLEFNEYRKYARRDVNNYTALTMNGKIKNKGVFSPPDLKHDVQAPIIQNMARQYLLYNEKPWIDVQSTTIHDFIFHFGATNVYQMWLLDLNTTDCILPTPLSKSNRWYVGPDSLNNKIVKNGGKRGNTISVPNGNNIVLCNTLINDTVPTDINTEYYIQKAWDWINACKPESL